MDTATKVDRLRECRQWGATEDAENTALDVIRLLPDDFTFGIFPTGFDEDCDRGNGGIRLQHFTETGGIVVDIDSGGSFVNCWRCDPDYSETVISTPAQAARYLT